MFKIIGGDGKEYGPVTADQVRHWIAEGRANAQTRVRAEGSTEWQPLSAFPEFADAFGMTAAIAPAEPPPQDGGRDIALQAVRAPATALKVTAILGFVAVGLGLLVNILALTGVWVGHRAFHNPEFEGVFTFMRGGFGIFQNIVGAAIGVLILIGAGKLERLEGFSFAMTASILAMVPCVSPCCWLGLPFGIWALVVMNRAEVKSQFR